MRARKHTTHATKTADLRCTDCDRVVNDGCSGDIGEEVLQSDLAAPI